MKIITVLVIAAAFCQGIVEGDCTAALTLLVLLGPGVFERSQHKKQPGEMFFGGSEQLREQVPLKENVGRFNGKDLRNGKQR